MEVEEEKDEEGDSIDTDDDCRLMLSFPFPAHKVPLLIGQSDHTAHTLYLVWLPVYNCLSTLQGAVEAQ